MSSQRLNGCAAPGCGTVGDGPSKLNGPQREDAHVCNVSIICVCVCVWNGSTHRGWTNNTTAPERPQQYNLQAKPKESQSILTRDTESLGSILARKGTANVW